MIEVYRLDYMKYKIEKYQNFKNFILLSLKNSIGILWDVFLIKKEWSQEYLTQNNKSEYKRYDMEINDLDFKEVTPIVKMRVSSTLFMVIFSAEIIDLLIWNKVNINNILDIS